MRFTLVWRRPAVSTITTSIRRVLAAWMVSYDGRRVGTTMLDHFHADAISPFLELLDCRCPKCVGRG